MTRLLAILSFFMSVIFYAWDISHGHWTWTLFMLLGLFLWCLSGSHGKIP
jgi:hypothetical protein